MADKRVFAELLTKIVRRIAADEEKLITIVQDELGYGLGRKGGSVIEYWRKGHLPPRMTDVYQLARLLVERGGLLGRHELVSFLVVAGAVYTADLCDELFPETADMAAQFYPTPFLAPPRLSHAFVGRDQFVNHLRRQLFAGQDVALFALEGLPGVGKTTLAVAVAHDEAVCQHFRDGVLWVGLGREPNVLNLLNLWGLALGISMADLARFATVRERANMIRVAIGNRRMLLVIDDAWQLEAALKFKLGGPHCAYLLTTRLPEVALKFAGAGAKTVQVLNEADALALLAEFVPQVVGEMPDMARALVKAVGGFAAGFDVDG